MLVAVSSATVEYGLAYASVVWCSGGIDGASAWGASLTCGEDGV